MHVTFEALLIYEVKGIVLAAERLLSDIIVMHGGQIQNDIVF